MEIENTPKTFVVTGATSGIGFSTARGLAETGASVIGIGRSQQRCAAAQNQLRALTGNENIGYITADLSIQAEVKTAADRIASQLASRGIHWLDGLVNNAGTFAYWLTLTPDGIELQWAVNHLAPFLLTTYLLPLLKAAPSARVVTVSSDSHYHGRIDWSDPQLFRQYNGLRAYGNTKLANVLFTLELNRRQGETPGIRAFAVDPGLVKTDIGLKGTPTVVRWVWQLRRSGGTGPEVPARGIVRLMTDPSIPISADVYWKDARPKQPSRAALDSESAGRLWALSERMCGLQSEVVHAID